MRNVSGKSHTETQNTQFMFSNFSETCAVYEIMWKNYVGLERPQMTSQGACTLNAEQLRPHTRTQYLILTAAR